MRNKLDARGPANTHEDKEWFKPLLEIKGLRTFHLATFKVRQPSAGPSTPENIRLESGLRELLCQDRPVDDNSARERVRNFLKKRPSQPAGGLANLDERMIEMVDLVGREPGQDREDEGSSLQV